MARMRVIPQLEARIDPKGCKAVCRLERISTMDAERPTKEKKTVSHFEC